MLASHDTRADVRQVLRRGRGEPCGRCDRERVDVRRARGLGACGRVVGLGRTDRVHFCTGFVLRHAWALAQVLGQWLRVQMWSVRVACMTSV